MLLVLLALWPVAGRFFSIPLWLGLIAVGVTALTLIGDVLNYFRCGRKLRAIRRNLDAGSEP
jgi:hypothetical protein